MASVLGKRNRVTAKQALDIIMNDSDSDMLSESEESSSDEEEDVMVSVVSTK
jgi:hypothetical protein